MAKSESDSEDVYAQMCKYEDNYFASDDNRASIVYAMDFAELHDDVRSRYQEKASTASYITLNGLSDHDSDSDNDCQVDYVAGVPQVERDHVIYEIERTERKYVEDMRDIITEWKVPLTQVLDRNTIDKIFMNIDEIYELHCAFAQMLKEVKDQVKGNRFVSKETV